MKTQIIYIELIINLLTVTSSFSQKKKLNESEVPAVVVSRFIEKHKTIKSHCWKKDGNNYIVIYKSRQEGNRYKLKGNKGHKQVSLRKFKKKETYTETGDLLKAECVLKLKDLPQVVKDSFKQSEFKEWKICKIKSITPSGQSKSYLIKLKKEKQKKEIYYDGAGKVINN